MLTPDVDAAENEMSSGCRRSRMRAEQQQHRVLQEERDAERGDQRRDPRRVAQRPVGEALDRDPQHAAPSPAPART